MSGLRSRSFLGILYPDSETYDCDEVLALIRDTFERSAWCLHDLDVTEEGELKKPHYHWVGQFSNPRFLDAVASSLSLPSNTIEPVKKFKAAIRYLIHVDNEDKYQYDMSAIDSDFDLAKYFDDYTSFQMAKELGEQIQTGRCMTVNQLYSYAIANGCWSEYRRAFPVWSTMISEIRSNLYEIHDS